MNDKLKRILAAVIDFYIICFLSTLLVCIFTLGELYISPFSVTIYLSACFIFLLIKDCALKNTSIGKRIFKLYVTKTDGANVTFFDIIKRNITLITLLPLELLLIIFTNYRLGDAWAKTSVTVLYDRKQ